MKNKKVLLIEDNQDMLSALGNFLEPKGFELVSCNSFEEAKEHIEEEDFSLAIIDINLPGESGFYATEYIREEGKTYPIIAMTARDSVKDKLKGFDAGMSDYIVKPFDLRELDARVKAQLSLADKSVEKLTNAVETKNFAIDPKSFEFEAYGDQVDLTQIEFKIMNLLMANNGLLVKTDDLINYVWEEDENLINPPVRMHIANLRKKIKDSDYQIIKTVPGVGYKLNDPEA